MSLTNCLKRAGKNISPADRKAIIDLAAEFRRTSEGKGAEASRDAAVRAVQARVKAMDDEIAAMRRGTQAKKPQPPKAKAEPADRGGGQQGADITPQELMAARLAEMDPAMPLMIDGMDGPMNAGDLLRAVELEAKDAAQNAQLLQLAAQCAIAGG